MSFRRTLSLWLAAWLALSPVAIPRIAQASQATLQMPTTGTVSGLQFSNDVTSALDALVTCNSGSSAPTNASGAAPKLGQCWLDTTSTTLVKKWRYTGAAWVLEGVIDVTNGIWAPPIGGGTATVASATTTSVCGVPQGYLTISGTTTITSFGTGCPAGQTKVVKFAGVLTLTYDATALILPAAASLTTAANDTAVLISEGSGNWRVVYFPASGQAISNPAVPIGTYLMSTATAVPSASYVFGTGQALTRTSYPAYLAATTVAQSGTRTSGGAAITGLSDTTQFGAGMPVEGTGIPSGATIASVDSGTQISLDGAHLASTSGTSTVTVFPNGYGSAGSSSTVGVPDCQGVTLAGRSNMSGTNNNNYTTSYSGVNGQALGSGFGSEKHLLTTAEMPSHNHIATSTSTATVGNASSPSTTTGSQAYVANPQSISITTTIANTGGGLNHAIMNPTRIANCFVRVLP